MKKLNNKGFTLIELLATIAVLAVVMSISAYIVTDVLGKARTKSYQVNKNEVEKEANSYALENSDKLFYVSNGASSNLEHQCVMVQNLIDLGYLKDNITKANIDANTTVSKTSYIYLERNTKTKAITKSVYNTGSYTDICGIAAKVTGDIRFESNPSLNTWSKTKTITISYSLKYGNINDSGYTTNYSYTGSYTEGTNTKTRKIITVTETGTVSGTIEGSADGKSVDESRSLKVPNIDNTKPTIGLGTYTRGTYSRKATITLSIKDTLSGVNTTTVEKSDFTVKIGTYTVSTSNLTLTKKNDDIHDLIYDLVISDSTHNGTVTISVGKDKIEDIATNKNDETNLNNTGIIFNQLATITYDFGTSYTYSYKIGSNTKNDRYQTQTCTIGQTCTLTNFANISCSSSSGSCSFTNWKVSGTNTTINNGGTFTPNGDTTLVANWSEVTCGSQTYSRCNGDIKVCWQNCSDGTKNTWDCGYCSSPSSPPSSSTCNTPINEYRCNTCTGTREYVSCCDTNTMMCGSTAWSCYANDGNAACNGSSSSPSNNSIWVVPYTCSCKKEFNCYAASTLRSHYATLSQCQSSCNSGYGNCLGNASTGYDCYDEYCPCGGTPEGSGTTRTCYKYTSCSETAGTGYSAAACPSQGYITCNSTVNGFRRYSCS